MKRVFISLLIILCFFILLPFQIHTVSATTKTYGKYTYTLNSNKVTIVKYSGKNSILTIPTMIKGKKVVAIGDCAFQDNRYLTKITIPTSITSIGGSAFQNCAKLNTVILPNTLEIIGSFAFSECIELSEINVPKKLTDLGSYAFSYCNKLKTYTIPDTMTVIGAGTFYQCASLKKVSIPTTVTSMERNVFTGCSSLTEIILPEGITQIGSEAFKGCTSLKKINIPEGIISVSERCFLNCSNLKDITLPNTIITIEGEAFSGCRQLVTNLPISLERIGFSAFHNCESLKQIILPDRVKMVEGYAFYNCKNATILHINNTIVAIAKSAFNGCSSIKKVTIPNAIKTLPDFADCDSLKFIKISDDNPYFISLDGVIFNKDKTTLLRYTPARESKNYIIPASVTTLNDYAFSGLSMIKNITIPDTVTNLGIGLFYGSSSIENVTFPTGTTKIPPYTFYGTNLKTVIVSDEIKEIGYQAYAYCKNLISITLPESVTNIGEEYTDEITAPFVGCDNLEKFIVNKKNKTYTVIDDVLYTKNPDLQMYLICYPSGKVDTSFTIPKGTIGMYSYAFYKCDNLKKLYLPESMIGIYSYFKECTNLKIMVPKTVTTFIGPEHLTDWPVFNDCTNCYLYVKANSAAYKYCNSNKLPYKIWY